MVANDRSESGGQKRWKPKRGLAGRGRVAYGERGPTLPGANLAGCPRPITAPQSFQRLGNRRLPVFQTSRQFVGDGCVYRLQAVQSRIQFGSDHEVRELSGKQI